ncbi:MAG: hypothetical protein Q9182_007385 [Xanthomendoza sp. 2 TL-2023]
MRSLQNKVHEAWGAFFRAFRLSLLAHALRGLRYPIGRGFHEPTKIALNQTRIVAIVRNLIHVIPVGFAIFEIILNWNVYYVGTQAYGTAVYQIIAKSHEISIQASLTTIMFSAIRRELAYGNGLPFGFLFPGLQITQISYLWSMELWGATKADSVNLTRRTGLFVLVIGSILLATTCGPASAILLTPRMQQWPAGSTHIWVNATKDQLWPTKSARELIGGRDLLALIAGQVASAASLHQAVVADALSTTSNLWQASLINITASPGHGSPLSDQTKAVHRIVNNYKQTFSRVACIPFGVTSSTSLQSVAIPLLPFTNLTESNNDYVELQMPSKGRYRVIKHPRFTYGQLLDAPGNLNSYRLKWLEFPQELFLGGSIGLAILFPESNSTQLQRTLICNILAAWVDSNIEIKIEGRGIGTTKGNEPFEAQFPSNRPISESRRPRAQDLVRYITHRSPITISESWARYLNPNLTNPNTTVFNVLMQQTDFTNPESFPPDGIHVVSTVLAMLTANGLARVGWGAALQGTVKTRGPGEEGLADGNYWLSGKGDMFEVDPIKSKNWTSFVVKSSLEGYAYNTLTTPPKLAIAIMIIYCVLVVGHTLYSGITGISSNCWDTIAEVTALAINSTPTTALRNTCAGISELHIFKLPVRILVSRDEEGEGEHLELVFGKVDDESANARTIKPNTTYGTLPKGCLEERKKDV